MRTAIVIVNWNGWRDTIGCLQAVLMLEAFDGLVVVCDNASTDGSILHLKQWNAARPQTSVPTEIQIIETGRNGGFAAGNNAGIRHVLAQANIDVFWLLNNDTVALPDAYLHLRAAMENGLSEPQMVGSVLLEYGDPNVVQACGGIFKSLTLSVGHHMAGKAATDLDKLPPLVKADYAIGASLAVNRAWVERVGMMSEIYFLYYEELDWILRDKSRSPVMIATRSRVLHKGGASTGSTWAKHDKSLLSDRFHFRGRIILARRLGLLAVLRAAVVSLLALLKRLLFGQRGTVANAFRGTLDGLRIVLRASAP